jgi:hypothetical protein
MDKYDEVALQIVDVIKENFSDISDTNHRFDDDIQKKITDALKNNFNIKYEDMGMNLMKDVNMFDPESGYEFDAPLFTTPMFIPVGSMVISSETFPNFGIDNKYIGYTDKGRFHRINDFTIFMRHMRKQPLAVIVLFVLAFFIVSILAFSIK